MFVIVLLSLAVGFCLGALVAMDRGWKKYED